MSETILIMEADPHSQVQVWKHRRDNKVHPGIFHNRKKYLYKNGIKILKEQK